MLMFGQPQFLPLLALASLPLLVHLLARRQRKIVKFSMTRFLQEVTQQTQGRRWLRELLLLLLRTGTILFALLTLLRPYASVPLPLPPAPTSIAIVLDNSLSMQSREHGKQTWFEQAVKWCEQAMRNLPAEIALFTPDKAYEPVCDFSNDLRQELKALRQIRPTFKALDLTPAIQVADTLLSNRPSAVKHIVVVTDMQSEPFRSLNFPSLRNPITVVDVKPSEQVGNVRLSAKLRLPLDPNTDGSVVVELQNLSAQPLKGTVIATVSEKPFARTEISLQPQAQANLTLPMPSWVLDAADRNGFVNVEVRWNSNLDFFGWDDFVRFSFKSPKRIRVVNALKEGRQFVDAALRALGILPIASASFSNADAVIASTPNDAKVAKELAGWVRQGGTAIIIADSVASPFWLEIGASVQQVRKSEKLRVRWVDETNPILKGLGASLQAVTVQPILELDQSGAKALVSLSDGTPLLVELAVGSGHCFIFTAPLSPQHTTLVYSPAFVPLIYRLIRFAIHGHELSAIEAETKPQALPKRSTVVPKSESDFKLPSRTEIAAKLEQLGGTLILADKPPQVLLAETKLRDLTSLCLFLALLCLLIEGILTAIWWGRAR